MARPSSLNTKGFFSVRLCSDGHYALVFKGLLVVKKSLPRHVLYRLRTEYSSWYESITLLQSTYTLLVNGDTSLIGLVFHS